MFSESDFPQNRVKARSPELHPRMKPDRLYFQQFLYPTCHYLNDRCKAMCISTHWNTQKVFSPFLNSLSFQWSNKMNAMWMKIIKAITYDHCKNIMNYLRTKKSNLTINPNSQSTVYFMLYAFYISRSKGYWRIFLKDEARDYDNTFFYKILEYDGPTLSGEI